jgi:integral membrane protein (TIGR00529 family)
MIGALQSLPVLVKVLGTLALILVLNSVLHSLLAAVACGTVVLGFWVGHAPRALARIAWARFASADNLLLLAAFFLIIWLSSLMAETGVMADLVATLRARLRYRTAFAALPAVIGFLPMPGGAVFSAPMVDTVDPAGTVPPWLKTQANYWFRHIWEYWWPLYPGVLLALDLTRLPAWRFLLMQLPLTGAAVLAGYLFFLRRIEVPRPQARSGDRAEHPGSGERAGTGRTTGILVLVAPIAAVIVVYMILQFAAPALTRASRYLPILFGLILALVVLQVQRRPGFSVWKTTVLSRRALEMAALIAAIRIYGAVIESRLPGGALLVEQMRTELLHFGIPQGVFVVLIPFVAGLALGLNVGAVGASFPVVLSLLGPNPGLGPLSSVVVLAYAFGYAGQLLSPVHVCLVVTSEYFRTPLLRNLARLLPPVALLLTGAWAVSRLVGVLYRVV